MMKKNKRKILYIILVLIFFSFLNLNSLNLKNPEISLGYGESHSYSNARFSQICYSHNYQARSFFTFSFTDYIKKRLGVGFTKDLGIQGILASGIRPMHLGIFDTIKFHFKAGNYKKASFLFETGLITSLIYNIPAHGVDFVFGPDLFLGAEIKCTKHFLIDLGANIDVEFQLFGFYPGSTGGIGFRFMPGGYIASISFEIRFKGYFSLKKRDNIEEDIEEGNNN